VGAFELWYSPRADRSLPRKRGETPVENRGVSSLGNSPINLCPSACAAESFLLFAGSSDSRRTVARVEKSLETLVPQSAEGVSKRVWLLDELNGGLVWVRPNAADREALLSVHDSPTHFVAVHGKLYGDGGSPAEAVHDRVVSKKDRWFPGVRAFDGSFTAIVVDRREKSVTTITDQIGCRALAWCENGRMLSVSPHAIALVGAGEVPLRWDLHSIASAVCIDWSIARRSFLSDINTLKPYEVLRWEEGKASINHSTSISFDSRIEDSAQARAQLNDAMVDTMVESTRHFSAEKARVDLLLTAGLDSRAVLGLLSAAGAKHLVRARTSGRAGSIDVEWARRLATVCEIPFDRMEPGRTSNDDFSASVRLHAFLSNGDSSAQRCLGKLPETANHDMVGGCGGEIFTGFYYPLFLPFGDVPDDPAGIAKIFMTRLRKGRWSALGAWDSPLQRGVRARLEQEIESYRDLGARRENLADLLYLWERYGQWGSIGHRLPWTDGWTPFLAAEAVRSLFRFPRSAGKHCDVHRRVIRRHLPLAAYIMPVNGSTFLPLRGSGETGFMLRQAQQAFGMMKRAAAKRLRTRQSEAGIDQVRAGMFSGENFDYIHSLLTDSRSLSNEVFGAKAIQNLLNVLRSSHGQTEPIGFLIMAENFRILAEQAAGIADAD
jgi:hypothetical protein